MLRSNSLFVSQVSRRQFGSIKVSIMKEEPKSNWHIYKVAQITNAVLNHCYKIFQAEDHDSMMAWISVIQANNNPDEDVSLWVFCVYFLL